MQKLVDRLLDLTIRIQGIPAPTFRERQRAEFVQDLFQQEGLQEILIDSPGNVFGKVGGSGRARPVVLSAHLDTVFPLNVDLTARREADRVYGPGIGDNSLGVAGLFGLLWMLRRQKIELAGDLWLVANVGEEGLGDLRGMKAVVDRFGADVGAYLVLEGTALGHVYHRALGVRRYRVIAHTAGGHSWSDYGRPSAVHELARLVTQLTAIPVPSNPRTTLNVGLISGGTGVNVLASEAMLELDLRSENPKSLDALIGQVEEKIQAANRDGVLVDMEVIGQRPAGEIPVDHPLVRLAGECLTEQGLTAAFTSGSTDANIPLSRGFPSVVLGITTGSGAHTVHEYIETGPIKKGMEQLMRFVEKVFTLKTLFQDP